MGSIVSFEKSPLEILALYPAHGYTLGSYLESRRAIRKNMPFLLCADQRQWSWNQFSDDVAGLAAALHARGIGRGECVAVVSRNDPTHVLTLFAVARLGAIMVPINLDLQPDEVGALLRRSRAKVVFADAEGLRTVLPVLPLLDLAPSVATTRPDAQSGLPCIDDLIRAAPSAMPDYQPKADDTCVIVFTSGSTGTPKGVMHNQRSYLLAGEAYLQRTRLQETGRVMVLLPLFHINALFYMVGGTVAAGASMLVLPRFSASTFWDTAAQAQVTQLNLVETIANILQARPRTEYRPDHRIRTISGGIRPVNEATFRNTFGIPNLVVGYGMTEIPGVIGTPLGQAMKPGSLGILGSHPDPKVAWAQCRIVDDGFRDVPIGTTGELVVKTPLLMQGYFDEPERTASAFRDGWFLTGDLIRQEADGHYHFVARKKDIIRRRGENISALEIDNVATLMPTVLEAACIGVPAELGDEEILLAVVPRADASVDAREVLDWCAAHLPPMKVPRYIAVVTALPHTGPSKIAKEAMRTDTRLRRLAVDTALLRPPVAPAAA